MITDGLDEIVKVLGFPFKELKFEVRSVISIGVYGFDEDKQCVYPPSLCRKTRKLALHTKWVKYTLLDEELIIQVNTIKKYREKKS